MVLRTMLIDKYLKVTLLFLESILDWLISTIYQFDLIPLCALVTFCTVYFDSVSTLKFKLENKTSKTLSYILCQFENKNQTIKEILQGAQKVSVS